MATIISIEDFRQDSQGIRFPDVSNKNDKSNNGYSFQEWLDFFNDPARQKRMEDSETHHDRPALAGVIKELEQHPAFKIFFAGTDSHKTVRARQAIGVLVRIIMERLGWETTGIKGSLGQRKKVEPGTTTPGGYINEHGLSKWFTKAERYQKTDN